jgi:hypothetical protein
VAAAAGGAVTGRDRRVLAVGGLIVLAALVLRAGSAGVAHARAALEQARERTALAARAQVLVAEGPVRQARLRERARAMVDLAPALVGGSSAPEAAAALAGELNAAAARHRVAVSRLDPLAGTATGAVVPVDVRIQAESDLAGVYGLVREIEAGPLLLAWVELAISGQEADGTVERLRLDGTVRGWMVARAAGRPDSSATGGTAGR